MGNGKASTDGDDDNAAGDKHKAEYVSLSNPENKQLKTSMFHDMRMATLYFKLFQGFQTLSDSF